MMTHNKITILLTLIFLLTLNGSANAWPLNDIGDEREKSDETARFLNDFNTLLNEKLENGEKKGIIVLNPEQPYYDLELPFKGFEAYRDKSVNHYGFKSLAVKYDFTANKNLMELEDCSVEMLAGGSAASGGCCETPPISNRLEDGWNSSKWSIKLDKVLMYPDKNSSDNTELFWGSNLEVMKVPLSISKNGGVQFKIYYTKNGDNSYEDHKITLTDEDELTIDIKNKFERIGPVNPFGDTPFPIDVFYYFENDVDNLVKFSKPGLYKLYSWVKIDRGWPVLSGPRYKTREAWGWICVYPDAEADFPDVPAGIFKNDPGCDKTYVGYKDANDNDIQLPPPYIFVWDQPKIGGGTTRTEVSCLSATAVLLGGGNATLSVLNPCTGGTREIGVVGLELTRPPGNTIAVSPNPLCRNDEGTLKAISTLNVKSYQWYKLKYAFNGLYYGWIWELMEGKTKSSLSIGPGGDYDINSSTSGDKGRYALKTVGSGTMDCSHPLPDAKEGSGVLVKVFGDAVPPDFTTAKTLYRVGEPVHLNFEFGEVEHGVHWFDGHVVFYAGATNIADIKYAFTEMGTHTITAWTTNDAGCQKYFSLDITIYDALCAIPIPTGNSGQFKMDKFTGTIVYDKDACSSNIVFPCVSGPSDEKEVISASAITFSDIWDYDLAYQFYSRTGLNEFETGERGKWRVKDTYTYNTDVDYYHDSNATDRKLNKEAGTFKHQYFNWQPSVKNGGAWLRASTIEKYSTHGEPLQELNALNISSTTKFGYNESVPILTAQNAEFNEVIFESFEKTYSYNGNNNYLEDGWQLVNGEIQIDGSTYHSGKRSAKLLNSTLTTRYIKLTEHIRSKGMVLQFWIKSGNQTSKDQIINDINVSSKILSNVLNAQKINIVAQNGQWYLCKAMFTSFSNEGTSVTFKIDYNSQGSVWLDDLRIEPGDTQMSTYVYDPKTLRLLTVFDSQHFGLYYQYNAEGKLIRKKIETERGLKTIQETQYNSPGTQYSN